MQVDVMKNDESKVNNSAFLSSRAFPGPGSGPLSGPGRGFQKNSGLRVFFGSGSSYITAIKVIVLLNLS